MAQRPTTQQRHVAQGRLPGHAGPGIGGPGPDPESTSAHQQPERPVNEIERIVEEAHKRGSALSFSLKTKGK